MVKVFGALSSFWKRRDCNDDCQRENGYMKAVILAGGLGTRISEETELIPRMGSMTLLFAVDVKVIS
jgi:hypothetical protein